MKYDSCPPSVSRNLLIRHPRPGDALAVNRLISCSPPLDGNSVYCNLLQCSHFSNSSAIALTPAGEIRGFISAYRHPLHHHVLFVWQVAVELCARGTGLGRRMLRFLMDRTRGEGITHIQTSINPDNAESRAMFTGFAGEFGASLEERTWFSSHLHFGGEHPDEILLEIGPLDRLSFPEPTIPVHAPTLGNSRFLT